MIFSIAMSADHSFYVKTIETHARAFLPLNISAIGTVYYSSNYYSNKINFVRSKTNDNLPLAGGLAGGKDCFKG